MGHFNGPRNSGCEKEANSLSYDHGIPYNVQKNFILALINHGRMLKKLGRYDIVPSN
jgi:hypothetical protein